jgi:hypothetical protein
VAHWGWLSHLLLAQGVLGHLILGHLVLTHLSGLHLVLHRGLRVRCLTLTLSRNLPLSRCLRQSLTLSLAGGLGLSARCCCCCRRRRFFGGLASQDISLPGSTAGPFRAFFRGSWFARLLRLRRGIGINLRLSWPTATPFDWNNGAVGVGDGGGGRSRSGSSARCTWGSGGRLCARGRCGAGSCPWRPGHARGTCLRSGSLLGFLRLRGRIGINLRLAGPAATTRRGGLFAPRRFRLIWTRGGRRRGGCSTRSLGVLGCRREDCLAIDVVGGSRGGCRWLGLFLRLLRFRFRLRTHQVGSSYRRRGGGGLLGLGV